jgi:hypothetical protein
MRKRIGTRNSTSLRHPEAIAVEVDTRTNIITGFSQFGPLQETEVRQEI